ncbi:MAG: S8 family serine peptidase [candidate division Zixibacteria bacterium]|nr:S8 family serine peptidase [candidate division Zixibacteria bacterium]
MHIPRAKAPVFQVRTYFTVAVLVALFSWRVGAQPPDFSIKLAGGKFTPPELNVSPALPAGHIMIQFRGPVTDADRAQLASAGIGLLDYLPDYAYTARIEKSPSNRDIQQYGIRWLGQISADQKLAPIIAQSGMPDWAKRAGDSVQITVALHRDESAADWSGHLSRNFGARVLGSQTITNALELILPSPMVRKLAALDAVSFIEPALPPQQEHNDGCRGAVKADSAQSAPHNLTGSGVLLGIWDGGRVDETHLDLAGRIISTDASDVTDHATHVAGTILGSGSQSAGTYKGMAPLAQTLTHLWWGASSEMVTQYQDAILNYGATISNNSWGVGVSPVRSSTCQATLGNYFIEDATIDEVIRGEAGAPIVIVWSAGNMRSTGSQYCGSIGWTWNTIDPLASSKNVIAVGAVNSNDNSMTSFSSWGPTDDGRIKPDLVAPGCQSNGDAGVTSTTMGGGYAVRCGTSMAAPVVSGVVALMKQRWNQMTPSDNLLPSTVKGILINTATDLGNTGPDFQYGWGLINAAGAVRKVGIGWQSYVESATSTGVIHTYVLTVPPSTPKLKVTLVWDDKGGTALAGTTLINDLDLTLIDPSSNQILPWVLNPLNPAIPATHGADHLNNTEAVEVANPSAGTWLAVVSGYNIPSGPQKYSLIFSPDSINGTTTARSVDVRKEQDTTIYPGQSVSVGFWVKNTGTLFDSLRVRLTDSLGWMESLMDSIVFLNPFDSVRVARSVTVPSSAGANVTTRVNARVNSISDTAAVGTAATTVTSHPLYSLVISATANDTAASPSAYAIDVLVRNTGNTMNVVTVTPVNDSGWSIQPVSISMNLAAGDSGAAAFSLAVPAEVPHSAQSRTSLAAGGSGGSSASAYVDVVIKNPLLPPKLQAPDTVAYVKQRNPQFVWSNSAISYRLVVSADSLLAAPVRNYSISGDSSFSMPVGDSLADGAYWWGVQGFAGPDSSSFQRHLRKLVIDNLPPAGLFPVWPVAGNYPNQKHFTFSFSVGVPANPVRAPEFNTLEVSSDSGFVTGVTAYSELTGESFVMPDDLTDGRWFWRVRREDRAGNRSAYSIPASFILDTESPGVPGPVSPPVGATVGAHPLAEFNWTLVPPPAHPAAPHYYRVRVASDSLFSAVKFDSILSLPPVAALHGGWSEGATMYWQVQTLDSAGWASPYSTLSRFLHVSHVCADWDNTSSPDIADLTMLISYLFLGGPEPLPHGTSSVDCEEGVDISDLTLLIDYLFISGQPLCCY